MVTAQAVDSKGLLFCYEQDFEASWRWSFLYLLQMASLSTRDSDVLLEVDPIIG